MSDNENIQNIEVKGNVDKSVITDGNQNIIHVHNESAETDKPVEKTSYLMPILIFLCVAIEFAPDNDLNQD